MFHLKWFVGSLFIVSLLTAVHARDFAVNTTSDGRDAVPGDGICETAFGNATCSLRAAVMEANEWDAEAIDTISIPAGSYNLTFTGVGEDFAAQGDLDIRSPMIVSGLGATPADVVISGINQDRVFDVITPLASSDGFTATDANGALTLNNVTIQDGRPDSFPVGGGIFNYGNLVVNNSVVTNNYVMVNGGGIFSHLGNLAINNSVISNNIAVTFGSGLYVEGGALSISNSAITNNGEWTGVTAIAGGGIALFNPITKAVIRNTLINGNTVANDGAGIYVNGGVELVNTTVSGNFAGNLGGGLFVNGGVSNNEGSAIELSGNFIVNSTIVDNTALDLGNGGVHGGEGFAAGGVHLFQGELEVSNSFISSNTGFDCFAEPGAALTSLGYNMDGDSSCNLIAAGDRPGTAVGQINLTLQDNGGPTLTHALVTGSTAIDAANDSVCNDLELTASVDQRGYSRPTSGCDIGAYEQEGVEVTPSPSSPIKHSEPARKAKQAVSRSVDLSLEGVNLPPLAHDVPFSTKLGQAVTGVFQASDPEGDELLFHIVDYGSKGRAALMNEGIPGEFVYIPEIGEDGADEIIFYACEVAGKCSNMAKAIVHITAGAASRAVSLVVDPSGVGTGSLGELHVVSENELALSAPDIDYDYPIGAVFFTVNDVPTDHTVNQTQVIIEFPSVASIPDSAVIRKLNINGEWETLPSEMSATESSAVINHFTRTVTLTLIDNDRFDRNPQSGIIDDPVALAVPSSGDTLTTAIVDSSSKSGYVPGGIGSVNFIWMCLVCSLLAMLRRKNMTMRKARAQKN